VEWKTFAATFAMVFVAEMGDKTQIAVFNLTAQGRPRLPVFLGATVALAATSLVAVAAGSLLRGMMTEKAERWIRVGSGLLFIGLGVWTLVAKEE
jgi:putative Ca2+/H+ antiporter (TMEM165/GDT1 family)